MARRQVRWGHLHEIDYRTKVGTEAWKKYHAYRLRHLSAYRRLHELVGHRVARKFVNSTIREKLRAIKRFEEELNGEESE
jgi:hypothetical protein